MYHISFFREARGDCGSLLSVVIAAAEADRVYGPTLVRGGPGTI